MRYSITQRPTCVLAAYKCARHNWGCSEHLEPDGSKCKKSTLMCDPTATNDIAIYNDKLYCSALPFFNIRCTLCHIKVLFVFSSTDSPLIILTLVLFFEQPPQSLLQSASHVYFFSSLFLSTSLHSFYHPPSFLLYTTYRLHCHFRLGLWVFDFWELQQKRWTTLCGDGCVFTTGYSANIQD